MTEAHHRVLGAQFEGAEATVLPGGLVSRDQSRGRELRGKGTAGMDMDGGRGKEGVGRTSQSLMHVETFIFNSLLRK